MSSQSEVEAELARLKGGSTGRDRRIECRRADGGDSSPSEAEHREAPTRGQHGGAAGVIVRILGEGQYDVSDDALDRLNELDAARRGRRRGRRRGGVRDRPGRAARRRTRRRGAARRRLARRVRPDPAAGRRHPRRGPGHAQRRRSDPGLKQSSPWHTPASSRHRADRPDDHGHVPARGALRRADRRADVRLSPAVRGAHRIAGIGIAGLPVVHLRQGRDAGDARPRGDARGGARAPRHDRPALRPGRHAEAPRGRRRHDVPNAFATGRSPDGPSSA